MGESALGWLVFMTGTQVADLLQVPPRTLEEWRQTRSDPPWRRMGRHVRHLIRLLVAHAVALAVRSFV